MRFTFVAMVAMNACIRTLGRLRYRARRPPWRLATSPSFRSTFESVASFLSGAGQNIDLRDDLAVGIHHDVEHISIKPVTMLGTACIRIGDTHRTVTGTRILMISRNLMRQFTPLEKRLPEGIDVGIRRWR
jgi:hypothetical protein